MSFLKEVSEKRKIEVDELLKEAEGISTPELMNMRIGGGQVLGSIERCRKEGKPFVIAEIKRASPSKGVIEKNLNASERAFAYQKGSASAISVLTEKNWFGGSLSDLAEVRRSVSIPVLMKDFIVDVKQIKIAALLGADMVLLIAEVILEELADFVSFSRNLGIEPLVEIREREELEKAIESGGKIVGINSRNLNSLEVDKEIFWRFEPCLETYRKHAYFIAESGISKKEEVGELLDLGYDGVLIGERMTRDKNPGVFLDELKNLRVERV